MECSKEEFEKFDTELFHVRMLTEAMTDALKYFETENGQCSSVIYLSEIILDKIDNILKENEKVLAES